MAAVAAPRIDTNVSADTEFYVPSVAAAAGDIDLTAIPGHANHCPQLVYLINNTTAAIAVVLTCEKNTNARTVSVPASTVLKVPTPVSLITKSGSGAAAVWAFWWSKSGVQFNRGALA